MESWQIFHVGRKKIAKSRLWEIWRRSTPDIEEWSKDPAKAEEASNKTTARTLQMWAADPNYCGKTGRNPIDRIRLFLDELDNAGQGHYTRAAIDYMAAPLGGHFDFFSEAKTDKGSVEGEVADVTISLGRLVEECIASLPGDLDDIMDKLRTVKNELDQLFDAARQRTV